MKKNLISLAVAASVLGGAAAQAQQHINPEKTGQVLLFPFYNADNGNATNMHIVNTTDKVKAVKVRFVEYKNSMEVLDFNLYLSKHDHFAFGVIKNPNGEGAAIITADNSCTVPALGSPNAPFDGTTVENASGQTIRTQPFVNYQYANALAVDSSIERTLTGHVEVIEMGEVTNVGVPPLLESEKLTQFAAFATHDATGVPANCAGLNTAWALGAFSGVTAPTGGLYGLAYHINVEAAAAFGFEPTAIDEWSLATQHTDPGSLLPSIVSGAENGTIYTPAYTPLYNQTDPTTIDAAAGLAARTTSALMMTESLSNDVMVNPAIGGMTDWVVTFPTKRAHVYNGAVTNVIAPFTDNYLPTTGTTTKKEKLACEPVQIQQWDREEQTVAAGLGFSPQPTATVSSICNEVAVIAMGPAGTASALSVTTGLTNLSATYAEGWQRITFGQTNKAGNKQKQEMVVGKWRLTGLPAVGFGAYKVNNGAMSYGNAAEHKTATNNVLSVLK